MVHLVSLTDNKRQSLGCIKNHWLNLLSGASLHTFVRFWVSVVSSLYKYNTKKNINHIVLHTNFKSYKIKYWVYNNINKQIGIFTLSYLIFVIAMAGVGQWMKSQRGTDQVKDIDGYTYSFYKQLKDCNKYGALRNVCLSTSAQLLLS